MFYDFKITNQRMSAAIANGPRLDVCPIFNDAQSRGSARHILHHMSRAEDGKLSRLETRPTRKADETAGRPALYLAPRELDVLKWAAQGKTTWETAQLLDLSEATVAFYARRACSRLGVKSKIHAVAICISAGVFKI